jgi:hypothetical protein
MILTGPPTTLRRAALPAGGRRGGEWVGWPLESRAGEGGGWEGKGRPEGIKGEGPEMKRGGVASHPLNFSLQVSFYFRFFPLLFTPFFLKSELYTLTASYTCIYKHNIT